MVPLDEMTSPQIVSSDHPDWQKFLHGTTMMTLDNRFKGSILYQMGLFSMKMP
jgi:hypothetical protein